MIDLNELAVPQHRAVELVRDAAVETAIRAYLVGGPVRDLFLGRPVADIDITAEGESSALARAVAKKLGTRVKSFPQFLTYKIVAENLPEIDVATARKERYRTPGALPSVTPGHLRDDLLRRDFSVNAIAVDVVSGAVHDPTGGEEDLRRRVMRVLHDASFHDDPTRIFRGIRLAERLGFTLEERTARLMREAIENGALRTIARERIWRELFLAMDEESAPDTLVRLVEFGALEVLFGRREPHREQLDAARQQAAGNRELDRYVLFTSALLHGDASPIELEGSGFSQKRARNVIQIANELPRLSDALIEARSERQQLRVLKQASPEMLGILWATRPERKRAVARFYDYQTFSLPLRGNELEVPGGPHVARALERTREAVFTGEISPAEARTFARQLAMKYLDRESASDRK